ncbi:MAG: LytTR family transcriptional regulator [Lentimicrobiaceae bacterium]|nr:LytTR family transcriptional regulator [Lentimicrobiaceae bacterium]
MKTAKHLSLLFDNEHSIHFKDEKGILRLVIPFNNLYYIESLDNYVNIFYKNKEQIEHLILRKSLKSIEEEYSDFPLVRCHRSFVVNIKKVKVLRKEKEGTSLGFDHLGLIDLPVSKTYFENVKGSFN